MACGSKGLAVVLVLMVSMASAAEPPRKAKLEKSAQASPRLVNADEGMAIIGAAMEVRYRRHKREDCSHLVHDIYQQAGFPYRYADSSDLYRGIDAFRSVASPQPGDLAVWKGHAAIVVNPAQHTFFSSTRRGLRVESYDLKYWKRRGKPRFFRYVTFGASTLPSITPTSGSALPTLQDSDDSRSSDRPADSDDSPDADPK